MTLFTCVMAWAGAAEDFVAYLQGSSTDPFVVSENIDLTVEGQHIVVAGTKEVTINEGVTLSLKSAFADKAIENGYDTEAKIAGFCFFVPEGAKLIVKGNGTIAADRSAIYVAEGGELVIGEESKASQLNITTSEARVKNRAVVVKGDAKIYNAHIVGRSGALWNAGSILIDGGIYHGQASTSDTYMVDSYNGDLYTYAFNNRGTAVLKNATFLGVHGSVSPEEDGRMDIIGCTLATDPANYPYTLDEVKAAATEAGLASNKVKKLTIGSFHGLYVCTRAIVTVKDSKIFSKSGYSIYDGNNDALHTFGLIYLYDNCYLYGKNFSSMPYIQKKKDTDEDRLFPVTISEDSEWYAIANTTGTTADKPMPLPSGYQYVKNISEVFDGRTYKVKVVSTIPAEQHESASTDVSATIPWQQETTWTGDVPAATDVVTIPEGKVVVVKNNEATTDVAAAQVQIQGEGASLTVEDGTSLEIGQSLNITPGAKLVVEAGAMVTVGNGGVVAADDDAVEVKMTEGKTGTFMIAPGVKENTHPMAKVELVSKAYKRGENDFVFQRFGVPAYMQGIKRSDMHYDNVAAPTAVWKLDYANNTWADMADDDEFIPFRCYELTTTAATPGAVYTFTCPLMGNGNAELELNGEWNYYANSYTAPIDVKELIASFKANYDEYMSATVYLYRASDNWWYELNEMAYLFDLGHTLPTQIDPMQAFIFQKRANGANPVVNYQNNVWNPIMNPSSPAPARNRESYNKAMIEITAADGTKDAIRMVENGKFSAAFDNSYDAAKYMNDNSFNLFVNANDEKLGSYATDDLNGTTISMTTKDQTSFTMTISNVNGMNYAVRDMLTGTEIEMVEGATYMFSVPANANVEDRFQIVSINKMPTAIENIEATAATKGIYTVSGQFVGYDYHNLQKGVYVVDGKKIVK